MASDGYYDWLVKSLRMQICSNLLCRFISIEDWHITVHENQIVITEKFVVVNDILNYFADGFFSVHCAFADYVDVIDVEMVLKNYFNGFNVEYFVVYDQNLLFVEHCIDMIDLTSVYALQKIMVYCTLLLQ